MTSLSWTNIQLGSRFVSSDVEPILNMFGLARGMWTSSSSPLPPPLAVSNLLGVAGAGQHRSRRRSPCQICWCDCPPAERPRAFPLHLCRERVVLVGQRGVQRQREREDAAGKERRCRQCRRGDLLCAREALRFPARCSAGREREADALPELEARVPLVLDLVIRPPRQLKRACSTKEQDHCVSLTRAHLLPMRPWSLPEDVVLLFG
jgi:hypothetical protein